VSGTTVCGTHGGRAPQVRAAARRRLVQAEAEKELGNVEVRPIGDPVVELAELAAEAIAIYGWAKAKAAEGEINADVLAVVERALDRAGKLLEACGRLGLEERRVRLGEAQLDLAAAVIAGVLRRAGIDPDAAEAQGWLEATYAELTASGG